MKKILSLILVLCLSLAISVTAFAAEIDTSGGTGSTPVELTTTNGGIGGGEDDIAPTKLSVTVPTALLWLCPTTALSLPRPAARSSTTAMARCA